MNSHNTKPGSALPPIEEGAARRTGSIPIEGDGSVPVAEILEQLARGVRSDPARADDVVVVLRKRGQEADQVSVSSSTQSQIDTQAILFAGMQIMGGSGSA